MSEIELFEEIVADREFYGGVGGVTFSGGEPLLQMSSLEPLLKRLKSEGLSICFETSLFIPKKDLSIALKYADFMYADIKLLNMESCSRVLRGDLSMYLENLRYLTSSRCNYVIRFPLVHGYTDRADNLAVFFSLVKELGIKRVELLRYHRLGDAKYQALGMTPPSISATPDSIVEKCAMELEGLGVAVDVLSL